MIDPTRWILTEVWIANGLRLEWGGRLFDRGADWIPADKDDAGAYRYRGYGIWEVQGDGRTSLGYTRPEAPYLSTSAMLHELAHWMVATEAERDQVNFGMPVDDSTELGREREQRTLAAERILQSMCTSTARIATMALASRPAGGPA